MEIVLNVAKWIACLLFLSTVSGNLRFAPVAVALADESRLRVVQPLHEYFYSFEGETSIVDGKAVDLNPMRFYTHIGTDFGRMGPGEPQISWKPGKVCVDLEGSGWAGMWHSLAGVARDKTQTLDMFRCYPAFVREEFQPKCVGVVVRANGRGHLKVEVKSARETLLWSRTLTLDSGDESREFMFEFGSADLRSAKLLNWVADPGAKLCVDFIGLVIEFAEMPFGKRFFLLSYGKLARCYSESDAVMKDRANFPAEHFSSVPASGLFCLATCSAWAEGIVDRQFAAQTLRKVRARVASVPTAFGVLPHFIRKEGETYRIHPGTEYSTIDTSVYYHSMLIAAQLLSDRETLAELQKAIKSIEFDRLRDSEGFVIHGFKDDGRTRLGSSWRDWGGETALVLLLEHMAVGKEARLRMNVDGRVYRSVGFISEIQSLFYPQFAYNDPDAITRVNWLQTRRNLLKSQMEYFPKYFPTSRAAKLGIYGLSAGEGASGVGYVANGTDVASVSLIHPHYIVMSALLRSQTTDTYATLQTMEQNGLVPPWGMVENCNVELSEYLPMIGSLNASFECIGAYHLWTHHELRTDRIYESANTCAPLKDAIQVFYPARRASNSRSAETP